MTDLLSDEEMDRWVSWKRATDGVLACVGAAITDATGLSVPDFSVLTRLVEEGGGSLRQQRLTDDLGWERSRLSRHLARMEKRGLVARDGGAAERRITATTEGQRLVVKARIAHAAAVRDGVLSVVPSSTADEFWTIVGTLGANR